MLLYSVFNSNNLQSDYSFYTWQQMCHVVLLKYGFQFQLFIRHVLGIMCTNVD